MAVAPNLFSFMACQVCFSGACDPVGGEGYFPTCTHVHKHASPLLFPSWPREKQLWQGVLGRKSPVRAGGNCACARMGECLSETAGSVAWCWSVAQCWSVPRCLGTPGLWDSLATLLLFQEESHSLSHLAEILPIWSGFYWYWLLLFLWTAQVLISYWSFLWCYSTCGGIRINVF